MLGRVALVSMVAVIALTSPRVVAAQERTTSRQTVVDSLTARLVELELHKVSPTAVVRPDISLLRDIASEIAIVHERLRAMPNGATADREANARVLAVLDDRAANIQAKLEVARQVYTTEHPIVSDLITESRAIDERRSAIRRGG